MVVDVLCDLPRKRRDLLCQGLLLVLILVLYLPIFPGGGVCQLIGCLLYRRRLDCATALVLAFSGLAVAGLALALVFSALVFTPVAAIVLTTSNSSPLSNNVFRRRHAPRGQER